MSFLVAAFSPLIGEKPFAPSFGKLFLFVSAVSPQTGEEGFLYFGLKYEKRVAIFSREQFSRVSYANSMRMCNSRLDFQPLWDSGYLSSSQLRLDHWSVALVRDVTSGFYANYHARGKMAEFVAPQKINLLAKMCSMWECSG